MSENRKIMYSNPSRYHIIEAGSTRTRCGFDTQGWTGHSLCQIDGRTVNHCPRCGTIEEFQALLEESWRQEAAQRQEAQRQIAEARASRERRRNLADELARDLFARLGVRATLNPFTGIGTCRIEHAGETFEIEIRAR